MAKSQQNDITILLGLKGYELPHNYCYRKWYRCPKKVLPSKEDKMTRGGIREYTEAVRSRYLKAFKKEAGFWANSLRLLTIIERQQFGYSAT